MINQKISNAFGETSTRTSLSYESKRQWISDMSGVTLDRDGTGYFLRQVKIIPNHLTGLDETSSQIKEIPFIRADVTDERSAVESIFETLVNHGKDTVIRVDEHISIHAPHLPKTQKYVDFVVNPDTLEICKARSSSDLKRAPGCFADNPAKLEV